MRDSLAVETQMPPPSYQDRFRINIYPEISLLHGRGSIRNIYFGQDLSNSQGPLPQAASTQQAVIADALTAAASLWILSLVNVTAGAGHGSPLSDQSNSAHRIATNYSQPYSTAVCTPDHIKNKSDSRQLAFPVLPFTNQSSSATRNQPYGTHGKSVDVIEHPNYSYHQLLDTPGDVQDLRLNWIELPGDLFNGSSLGAAVLLPPERTENGFNLLLCNLAAGWSLSSLVLKDSNSGWGITESFAEEGKELRSSTPPISETLVPEAQYQGTHLNNVYRHPGIPQRAINISRSWAQYLNPSVEGRNTSLFNVLSQENGFPGDLGVNVFLTTMILVMLLANGLARTGWGSTLQGDVKSVELNRGDGGLDGNYWLSGKGDVFRNIDPAQSRDWVSFRVDSSLQGYSYNTLTTPPRIAIAILTAYCLLVVGHTLYTGTTGEASFAFLVRPWGLPSFLRFPIETSSQS